LVWPDLVYFWLREHRSSSRFCVRNWIAQQPWPTTSRAASETTGALPEGAEAFNMVLVSSVCLGSIGGLVFFAARALVYQRRSAHIVRAHFMFLLVHVALHVTPLMYINIIKNGEAFALTRQSTKTMHEFGHKFNVLLIIYRGKGADWSGG